MVIGIIGLVIFLLLVWILRNEGWDMLCGLIPAFMVISVVWFLFSLPCSLLDGVYSVDIIQLKTATGGISGGGSFLGWSVSGGERQYIIMQDWDGKMKREYLPQEHTYIIESDTNPRVEYKAYLDHCPKWRSMPFFWDCNKSWHCIKGATIYVPKGTVIAKFDEI